MLTRTRCSERVLLCNLWRKATGMRLGVSACLLLAATAASCVRHETPDETIRLVHAEQSAGPSKADSLPPVYDHVAKPGRAINLENVPQLWLADFAAGITQTEGIRPNVLLISLDTLRADHLGAWGYPRATSPFLDELARFGVRFDRAISHSPATAPSHMSVFTGSFPADHGAHIENTMPPKVFPVRTNLVTLPEIMKDAGYRTAAWTGGGQMTRKAGFARGFDHYEENLGQLNLVKMQAIRNWFQQNSDTPCFLFLHTYQIHDPYLPPHPYDSLFTSSDYRGWVIGDRAIIQRSAGVANHSSMARMFWRTAKMKPDPGIVGPNDRQHLIDLYDGGIRYSDDVLRGFFEALRDDGLLANTLVIVFSDHGEEFLEHGGLLHEKLYQETLRVPLIFYWAGRIPTGVEVEAQVPLMDLTPTLLDLVSIEKPVESNARSLLPLLEGGERSKSRLVYSEAPWIYRKPYQRSFRNLTHMLYDHGRHHVELFRTGIDPLELEDQSAVMPHLASALYRELEAYLENKSPLPEGSPETARELSDEEIEALKALGYVR